MREGRAMTEPDLRPAPEAGYRPEPTQVHAQAKWWEPLRSKWAILGVIIFVGLVIKAADYVATWFGAPSETATRSDNVFGDWNKLQAEVAKLDAAAVGQRLIALLSSLPGDHPKSNFFNAHMLAAEYARKWDQEEKALEAKLSEIMRQERKKSFDANYRALSGEFYLITDGRHMIAVLKENIGKTRGGDVQYFAQGLNKNIEKQAAKAAEMPVLAGEIEQLLSEWKSTPQNERAGIRKRISERITAYRNADKIRRLLPSTPPETDSYERQNQARARLDTISGLSFDAAVKVIVENLNDVSERDIDRATQQFYR
jgi:ElaB/YqjD/DUF883 family membrane-anchored ribosome-binding protein